VLGCSRKSRLADNTPTGTYIIEMSESSIIQY